MGLLDTALNEHIVGQFCIARGDKSGVHAGYVIAVQGTCCVLRESRRLWAWKSRGKGVALSSVAQNGLDTASSETTVDAMNPYIYLSDTCELIPCSDDARGTILSAPIGRQD